MREDLALLAAGIATAAELLQSHSVRGADNPSPYSISRNAD